MPVKSRNIAVMGMKKVGKSSLTCQFMENIFSESYNPTIEDQFNKEMTVESSIYNCTFIDTSGQDEHTTFPHSCFFAHAFILIYSVNNLKSFEMLPIIRKKILENIGTADLPLVIVGNKLDQVQPFRVVSEKQGELLAQEWNARFFEASAKENINVLNIFNSIVSEIEKSENPRYFQPPLPRANDRSKECRLL